MLRDALRLAIFALCAASGFAALTYQVIWQRLLTLVSGTDTSSITIIVSAFMAGLGVGSLAGGRIADRLTPRARLWAIAGCELAIAGFALISVTLYYDVLYLRFATLDLSPLAIGALSCAVTLWPTFFMGMTFPLAARILADGDRVPHRTIAGLYAANTLGAALGAAVTTNLLLPAADFRHIVQLGAAVNLGGALIAGGLAWVSDRARAVESDSRVTHQSALAERYGLSVWLIAFALAGLVAIALEMIWFRVLGVVMKSNAQTFGRLLSFYLAGVGLGALAAQASTAQRWPAAKSFFVIQALIPVSAVITLATFIYGIANLPVISRLSPYLSGYSGMARADEWSMPGVAIGIVVPLWLMGAPTFLMGLSFGSLQRAVQRDVAVVGWRVGCLQAANIAGASAGGLAVGFILLNRIGSMGIMELLIVFAAFFTWLALRAQRPQYLALAGAGVVLTGIIITVPDPDSLWPVLHGTDRDQSVVARDSSGISVLREGGDDRVIVYLNGLGQSELPYGGLQSDLGVWPVMLHPKPVDVAVIGLGSGNTVFSSGGRPETLRIDSIEIVAPTLISLRALATERRFSGLDSLLRNPRVRYHVADGRSFLARSSERYDVIEADALRPSSAYAGNLYSVEYFALLRRRLKPGGFAVTWVPTARVRETLRAVFPHAAFWGEIGIGSERPITVNANAIRTRVSHPFTQAYYRKTRIRVGEIVESYLGQRPILYGPRDRRPARGDLNEDLFPRDEFQQR